MVDPSRGSSCVDFAYGSSGLTSVSEMTNFQSCHYHDAMELQQASSTGTPLLKNVGATCDMTWLNRAK